jgi:GGDEF domain-containing protein
MNNNTHDELTGLFNMSYMKINYSKYLSSHTKAKMIASDLTDFKYINDRFGITVLRFLLEYYPGFLMIVIGMLLLEEVVMNFLF